MKSYILKVISFCIPVFLILFGVEISIRSLPNSYKYKDEYLRQHKDKIEVLVLGHSQTEAGVIPENITLNCFSFAINGQSLRYDYEILHKYIYELTNLKYIIIPISNFSLYFEMYTTDVTRNRALNYPLYLDIKSAEIPFIRQFECVSPDLTRKLKAVFKNWFKHNIELDCLPLGNNTEITEGITDHETWMGYATYEAIWQSNCIKKGTSTRQQNELRLKSMIEVCKSKGIKILFITPPVSELYRDIIKNTNLEIKETVLYCRQLDKSNFNVDYINLFDDPAFNDRDYLNPTHLNWNGAEKFTSIINDVIMQYELNQN